MVTVPADFEVQPIDPNDPNAKDVATCGTCGLSWDDGIPTSWTPAPSGRCPFEYFHEDEPDDEPTLDTPAWVRERAHRGLEALKDSEPEVLYEVLEALSHYRET